MRVLIATGLYPPDVGGPATYSKTLFDELPKRNIDVKVLSFGSVRNLSPVIRHIVFYFKVLRAARVADIIYAQDPVSVGLPAALAAWSSGKRFMLKIVGDFAWEQGMQRFGVREVLDDFLGRHYGLRIELYRKIEKFTAGRAEQIIVPSEYLKKVVVKWGISPDKIRVIYNSFEAPKFTVTREAARRELGIGVDVKVIVSAGRNVPWKGFETLREIMPEISKEVPQAKLFILHNEPKEKLINYLAAADVFVLNTSYEGLSHQILEAMTLGSPIVTTDVGGNPELIEDGTSGLLVKFNDKTALKSKILQLLNNASLASILAENAQKKAQEFSLGRMLDETVSMLTQTELRK